MAANDDHETKDHAQGKKNNTLNRKRRRRKTKKHRNMDKSSDNQKTNAKPLPILQKIRNVLPFLWPKNNLVLQIRVILCVIILIATRVVTVFVPIYQKKIVNSLTLQPSHEESDERTNSTDTNASYATATPALSTTVTVEGIQFRWDYILIYILLRSLRSGYLATLRAVLWVGVSQDTKRRMRVKLFTHLHNLSLQWHLQRKTGEVLKVMDRGVNSISTVLSHVVFNIMPVFADVLIGVVYFVSAFNVYIGLIVLGAMVGYVICTVVLTEWRTKYRRKMNDTENEKSAVGVDSILNFETVKYYAAEEWETQRYAEVVDKNLHAEKWFIVLSNMVSCVQQTIIGAGLLGGSLLCAWYVCSGSLTVGDYVLFASYVEYMYGPLGNFGNQYRLIQQSFIDMENMFEMLAESDKVVDEPDAKDIIVHRGEIEFKDVNFSYIPERQILHNINFKVDPGKTVALVGHTGSGKSTILRLLLRFYDTTDGTILIDGQSVKKVKQKSLRREIGVVPQDTVLFNNTIRYNVRYGRVDATDPEVEAAAAGAHIHHKVLTFPNGYDSKVGERGLKLAGGEKQRIAIARTLLKNPTIVLLDEATSALDTKTERTIQAALSEMCKNRTTIIVAHRLSTIVHADTILVMREGEIIERGSHSDLMEVGEMYAEMWQEQQKNGDDESNSSSDSDGRVEDDDDVDEDSTDVQKLIPHDEDQVLEEDVPEICSQTDQSHEHSKQDTSDKLSDDAVVVVIEDNTTESDHLLSKAVKS